MYEKSKIKTTLREFILEQLSEIEGYSTNIEGNKIELLKNDKVVGHTLLGRITKDSKFNNEPYIILWDFLIEEEYRGNGYSKILLEKALEHLSKMVNIVDLSVYEWNKPAVKLYKSFGFETYNNTGHGVLYMAKRF